MVTPTAKREVVGVRTIRNELLVFRARGAVRHEQTEYSRPSAVAAPFPVEVFGEPGVQFSAIYLTGAPIMAEIFRQRRAMQGVGHASR